MPKQCQRNATPMPQRPQSNANALPMVKIFVVDFNRNPSVEGVTWNPSVDDVNMNRFCGGCQSESFL
eukprot:3673180-Pyramimonas_sp.AAC.1